MSASSMPSVEARHEQADRLKRSQELAALEDAVRHTRYSINLMIDHEKKLQTRIALIQKSIKRNEGRGGA
jgi:hypothetical protein